MVRKSFQLNYQILIHIVGWICFLFYPFILGVPFKEELFYRILFYTVLLIGLFYFNAYFLVPRFLTKGKGTTYILSSLGLIILISFMAIIFSQFFNLDIKMLEHHSRGSLGLKRIFKPIFPCLFILAISTSYRLLLDWFKNEDKKKEIEKQSLVSELSFLKSQVSPHFLFNTLNNIYSLSLNNSSLTADAILKLSQLLRYMIYEAEEKQVSLSKEIEYIDNYIELQKMRLRGDIDISFIVDNETRRSPIEIEPMLLIPFIENAFKHGINYSGKSYINIDIKLRESILLLKVENNIHSDNLNKDKNSGIGLPNVKRRLDLLYPQRYKLNISEEEGKYIVVLEVLMKKS